VSDEGPNPARAIPQSADDVLSLLAEARRQGRDLSLRQILEGPPRYSHFTLIPPRIAVDFIVHYFSLPLDRVIDPSAGSGLLLNELVARANIQSAVGIVPTYDDLKLARAISVDSIEWLAGSPLRILPQLEGRFDAVVSIPAFGHRRSLMKFSVGGRNVDVVDDESHLAVIAACQRLTDDGEAIFATPDAFFSNEEKTGWRAMQQFGLYPSAVIGLPHRSLAPMTSMPASLVVIGRKPSARLFVGQIDADSHLDVVIGNLRASREGAVPKLGRLVALETFKGVRSTFEEDRISVWSQREELEARTLDSISERIAFFDRRRNGFVDAPNSVYVSMVGIPKTGAATTVEALRTSPENCFQLVLKTDQALAQYVATFFNSERGRTLRASWSVGATVQRIQRRSLGGRLIYLPPIDRQSELVRLNDIARNLRSRLDQIESDLWETPTRLAELRLELDDFVEDEGAWIERLPFPLASILWRYYADIQPRDKVEHLLHFFEALAIFNLSILLSGFQPDQELFARHRTEWLINPRSLRRPSFGTWTTLNKRVAATVRTMLTSEEALCLDLFQTSRTGLLEALISEEFEGILELARERRNDWSGHAGVASARVHREHLEILETDLSHFRKVLGSAFSRYEFLRPRESRYHDGIYHYTADSLMGSRRDFRTINVDITTPMDEEFLYILDLDTPTPLQLIPFFRIKPGPATGENACYFYNRVESNNEVRLVSYHFEGESEFRDEDQAIVRAIEYLTSTP
jgi:hypothetical protein